jgi:NADH:ubiquinone oxidoreductase subunit F (NADH-binding)
MSTFLPAKAGTPAVLTGRTSSLQANPADLDAAVRAGAYEGLRKAVRDGGTTTIATIGASRLRGRGGAGHPAADKWRAVASASAVQRYVVANGYGADPSVRIDQELLAADPHLVIEGLAIAAYAVGASEAILVVRGEEAGLVAMLEGAVADATDANLLGEDILGSGHTVNVTIRGLQGAYMLGEETVLLRALEGKRGQPEQRPPYPAERGLFDKPTLVHNVLTLASVPWIVRLGGEAYAAIGTPDAPGTTLVQVRGPQGGGIIEVALGTPLREIVAAAGGTGGRSLKALLVGGSTGGLLPVDLLDTPYDYASLQAVGAHVGSGSVVVADDRACVVDLARLLTRFSADNACGKSIPCRIGLRRLSEIGDRIAAGTPRANDAVLLEDLAHDISASALCDHERKATLALTSAMRHFRSELDDHLVRSTCPAGVCTPITVGAGATAAGAR